MSKTFSKRTKKDKIEDHIPKKIKCKSQELINPIILLEHQETNDLEPNEYIKQTRHNTPRHQNSYI